MQLTHVAAMNNGFCKFGQPSLCAQHLSHKVVHIEFNFVRILRVRNSPWALRTGRLQSLFASLVCGWLQGRTSRVWWSLAGIELVLSPVVSCVQYIIRTLRDQPNTSRNCHKTTQLLSTPSLSAHTFVLRLWGCGMQMRGATVSHRHVEEAQRKFYRCLRRHWLPLVLRD